MKYFKFFYDLWQTFIYIVLNRKYDKQKCSQFDSLSIVINIWYIHIFTYCMVKWVAPRKLGTIQIELVNSGKLSTCNMVMGLPVTVNSIKVQEVCTRFNKGCTKNIWLVRFCFPHSLAHMQRIFKVLVSIPHD